MRERSSDSRGNIFLKIWRVATMVFRWLTRTTREALIAYGKTANY